MSTETFENAWQACLENLRAVNFRHASAASKPEYGKAAAYTLLDLRDIPDEHIPDISVLWLRISRPGSAGILPAKLQKEKLEEPHPRMIFLHVLRSRVEPWTEKSGTVFYEQLYEIIPEGEATRMRGCAWKKPADHEKILTLLERDPEQPLESVAGHFRCAILSLDQPFRLEVLKIGKPWGHEGWYTGVEKRGVVCVTDEHGRTELPYALGLFREKALGDHAENLILLKTLNPLPQPVMGDLYLEMHEEKWETYVVTAIDPSAWPSGTGVIKAGFAPGMIRKYRQADGENGTSACPRDCPSWERGHPARKWESRMLADFQDRIQEYESIRRKIDALLDQAKQERGLSVCDAVSPEVNVELYASVSEELKTEESRLREEAEQFVGSCPVRVGDVVSFPPLQMHSLQHGIRVIEFQTPHYERLIVMFAQKVLTQDHWDTAKAIARMNVEPYHPPRPALLKSGKGFREERIVDFPDFVTDRILLKPEHTRHGSCSGNYHLLIVVLGTAMFQTCLPAGRSKDGVKHNLNSGDAIFIQAGTEEYQVGNAGSNQLVYLKAAPKTCLPAGRQVRADTQVRPYKQLPSGPLDDR